MPTMIHIPYSQAEGGNSTSKGPSKTFTGDVYLDKIFFDRANTIANVTFTPCARTHWHTHEGGQLIRVVAGSGWVCDRGDKPKRLRVGDTVSAQLGSRQDECGCAIKRRVDRSQVWCPPGTEHWHGADDGSYMVHFVHAHGSVDWLEAVSDEDYAKKSG
jgi:quercetin dioxygenase-like cupin family protein